MTQDYPKPIAPPPELIEKWHSDSPLDRGRTVANAAAQWGADQELEACCEWAGINLDLGGATSLRAARRPKTSSLKEQALNALHKYESGQTVLTKKSLATIRRALEQLPE